MWINYSYINIIKYRNKITKSFGNSSNIWSISHLFIFNTFEKPLLTADADRGLEQKNPISPKLSPFFKKKKYREIFLQQEFIKLFY